MSTDRGIDSQVLDAQRRNLARMSDDKLRREWRLVTGFSERPAIREAYISQMASELARRGLGQE
jgi:hypothetical protein